MHYTLIYVVWRKAPYIHSFIQSPGITPKQDYTGIHQNHIIHTTCPVSHILYILVYLYIIWNIIAMYVKHQKELPRITNICHTLLWYTNNPTADEAYTYHLKEDLVEYMHGMLPNMLWGQYGQIWYNPEIRMARYGISWGELSCISPREQMIKNVENSQFKYQKKGGICGRYIKLSLKKS